MTRGTASRQAGESKTLRETFSGRVFLVLQAVTSVEICREGGSGMSFMFHLCFWDFMVKNVSCKSKKGRSRRRNFPPSVLHSSP